MASLPSNVLMLLVWGFVSSLCRRKTYRRWTYHSRQDVWTWKTKVEEFSSVFPLRCHRLNLRVDGRELFIVNISFEASEGDVRALLENVRGPACQPDLCSTENCKASNCFQNQERAITAGEGSLYSAQRYVSLGVLPWYWRRRRIVPWL